MSSLTVVATPEPGNSPPRVRVEVTDTGTPEITEVTVIRTGPDGTEIVRTATGGPLQLTASGVDRVGTVDDYEASLGQIYTYSTVETPVTASGQVTLTSDEVWLVHPGIPALSRTVTMESASHRQRTYAAARGVFHAHGRRNPIVISDGARKSPASVLTLVARGVEERDGLLALLADVTPLLLNIPPGQSFGVKTAYLAVEDVVEDRKGNDPDPWFVLTLPYQVVDRPAGGSQALRTYGDVLAENASYDTLRQDHATYADVLAPTG